MTQTLFTFTAGLLLAALAACGGGTPGSSVSADAPLSSGQVATAGAPAKVTHYAASRFAEQASFGPTPALVAEIRAKGFDAWIDEQFALPLAPLDLAQAEEIYKYPVNSTPPQRLDYIIDHEMVRVSLSAPDQLRWRVTWSLTNFLVTGMNQSPAQVVWVNLLNQHALGNYGALLRGVSLNRHMGWYLNNDQNRPKSPDCEYCFPNENYARELMQLFSIGVAKLNPDGTPQRDRQGRLVETYTQTDVEELARALTGWVSDPVPAIRPERNWANWAKPMVPSIHPLERDSGRKVVMGKVFPAGQSHAKDLDDVVALLMAHPNTAPFIALRLIQHLVKSNPSPAYVARVGAKFKDNGSGVTGDLKAVVKAVLLDAEARRGDNPAAVLPDDGKFREPWLHRMALFRGLGCARNLQLSSDNYWYAYNQRPLRQPSVFGYYAPTDRAPGSNLLAPEQRLLGAAELQTRFNDLFFSAEGLAPLREAGCDVEPFLTAYGRSPKELLDLLSTRYFRGAMPPALRLYLEEMMGSPQWRPSSTAEGLLRVLTSALATQHFGVVK